MNFLERAFLYSMALTIVLGFVSIAHIALIKMNLIAEIKSWFGPAKVRKEFRNELCYTYVTYVGDILVTDSHYW